MFILKKIYNFGKLEYKEEYYEEHIRTRFRHQ